MGLKLAFTGTIKDEILDKEEVTFYLVKYLLKNHLNNLAEKYKLNIDQIKAELEQKDENELVLEILEMIGKNRGCLVSRTEK